MDSNENNKIFISKETIKRLIKDVREIVKNPLNSHGIYYEHSKDDILSGQALIIGPKNTPYECGYYLFEFNFPNDYPHNPPVVKYHTNDGITRFNPNLYKNGKVCISILNTWQGEQWTGCQSISSVLLSLCTLLNDYPLCNEPGILKSNYNVENYNNIITFKNFKVAIMGMIKNVEIKKKFPELYEIMKNHFIDNIDKIVSLIDEKKISKKYFTIGIYNMHIYVDYTTLKEEMLNLHTNFLI